MRAAVAKYFLAKVAVVSDQHASSVECKINHLVIWSLWHRLAHGDYIVAEGAQVLNNCLPTGFIHQETDHGSLSTANG